MNENEFKKQRARMNKYKHYGAEINKLKSYIELLTENKEVKLNFNFSSTYWLVSGNEKNQIIEIMNNSIQELKQMQEEL